MTVLAVAEFDAATLILGGLLMVGALASGLAHRSFLSLTAVFVVAGFVLGEGGLEVIEIDPRSEFVHDLAVVALIVILFRDGLEVEAEMLQREWRLPLRKLIVAMPLTCVIVAVATHFVLGFGWTASFLLGALLSPTDPVLSSSVVTNPRVPRVVRHSLNLESGLNDGLALPAVLAFSMALSHEPGFVWWHFVLQDVSLGFVFGVGIGLLAAWLIPRSPAIPAHQVALYALGTAFATYGLTVLPPAGNGLIAVFVCAITLGIRRHDLREVFEARSDDIVEIVKVGVFVVFGSLLTLDGLFGDGWAAVTVVVITLLVARPVAIAIALLGTRLPFYLQAFMAWFGPKGVATMTFSLLILDQGFSRIFNVAALCVFASILAHGLSDTPGSEWVGRRAELSERRDAALTRAARPAPGR